jgi:hypothetical protein
MNRWLINDMANDLVFSNKKDTLSLFQEASSHYMRGNQSFRFKEMMSLPSWRAPDRSSKRLPLTIWEAINRFVLRRCCLFPVEGRLAASLLWEVDPSRVGQSIAPFMMRWGHSLQRTVSYSPPVRGGQIPFGYWVAFSIFNLWVKL